MKTVTLGLRNFSFKLGTFRHSATLFLIHISERKELKSCQVTHKLFYCEVWTSLASPDGAICP